MKIVSIHSFLVRPAKGLNDTDEIRGSELVLKGKTYRMLNEIFQDAPNECDIEIMLKADNDEEQKSSVKDLLTDFTSSRTLKSGVKIARKLQDNTTKRSGLGLFFLMVGKVKNRTRLVLARFPAESGILADESDHGLQIEFVERVFMPSTRHYKSAVFEGTNETMHFWEGKVVDKQVNDKVANYWMKSFLNADLRSTDARGSRRLAKAIRSVFNDDNTPAIVREELSSALKLSKGLDDLVLSASSFLDKMYVGKETKSAVLQKMDKNIIEEKFRYLNEEVQSIIRFRSIELDNGAFLSAEAGSFEKVFNIEKSKEGKKYSTSGKVVIQKIKKTR